MCSLGLPVTTCSLAKKKKEKIPSGLSSDGKCKKKIQVDRGLLRMLQRNTIVIEILSIGLKAQGS